MRDWVKVGRAYATDTVLGDKWPTSELVKLQARLTENNFQKYSGPESPYYFDPVAANAVCDFLASLRNVADGISTRAGDPFELMDHQAWIFTNLFGWKHKSDGKNLYRRLYLEEGRGNGKTTGAAGVMLYKTFACGIHGAQGVCAASLFHQARLVLDTARSMVRHDENLRSMLDLEVTAHTIVQPSTGSKLWGLPAKALSAEGLSLDAACLDEVHAQRGRSLHDCLSSGVAKRNNSLFMMVTTAGDDSSGVAFMIRTFLEKLLTGEVEDPTFFAAMFSIDAADDWQQIETAKKANPGWGVTVSPRVIEEEINRAKQIPGSENNYRTRHLCEWVQNGGDEPFLDDRLIKKCFDKDLDEKQFEAQPAIIGADLASLIDMCSVYRLHSRRSDKKVHHYLFGRSWLPESRKNATPAYAEWAKQGELIFTPGRSTDLDIVESSITDSLAKWKVRDFNFDPAQSQQMMGHLEKAGAVVVAIPQIAKNFTPALRELQSAIYEQRLHTNSPLLIWALGNLRVKTFGTSLLQPCRPARRDLKIDPAIAMLMALRSAVLLPLDEVQRGPRIFVIDWKAGTLENPVEKYEREASRP